MRRYVIALSLGATMCVHNPASEPASAIDARQWRSVRSGAPLVTAACLQSLIALSEANPQASAYARFHALNLARLAGMIGPTPQTCATCEPPKDGSNDPAYLDCLVEHLDCLRPR